MAQPTPRHPVPAGDGIQVPTVAAPVGPMNTPHQSDDPNFPLQPALDTGHAPEAGAGQLTNEPRNDELAIMADAVSADIPIAILDMGNRLDRLEGDATAIRLMLAKELEQPDEDEWVTMTTREYRMDRRGRRYLNLFVPVNVTGLVFSVQAVTFTYNLAAGWNHISLPNGSTMAMPSGSQIMLVRLSNWYYGSAI